MEDLFIELDRYDAISQELDRFNFMQPWMYPKRGFTHNKCTGQNGYVEACTSSSFTFMTIYLVSTVRLPVSFIYLLISQSDCEL